MDRLIDGGWYKLKVHYTQYELSTIIGGARVTISKLINELCDEGFIRMLNRNVQVNQDRMLMGHSTYPLAISKDSIV